MGLRYHLGIGDYIVIAISLLISAAIGIMSKYHGGQQNTTKGFLMAGRSMSKIPVVLSVIVTFTCPTALLSAPAEIYGYGVQQLVALLGVSLGIVLAAYVFTPVYYQCRVSTVNEFIEMRYGKYTRTVVSVMLFLQMLVYMAVAMYGSVLALSAVTDLSMEISIISLGVICTFYCSVGGLKAVLWTDAYQFVLICICLVAIYATGIPDGGGLSTIFNRLHEGERANLFDFEMEFFKRYNFWNSFSKGLIFAFCGYGTNQIEVQRLLSLSNAKRARSTLLISVLPVTLTYFFCLFFGVVLYSIYFHCDPILNNQETGLDKYDQIIPYYMVTRFSSIPGMTGLCIAGIFSASLSTVSSALNSLSTVTVVDFIKPILGKKRQLSDSKTVYLAKGLSLLYGGICIGLSFSFLGLTSLVQIANGVINSAEGTMLVIFLFGVLTRKVSDKVAAFCFSTSVVLMSWISLGSLYSGHVTPPLPLSTSMCPVIHNGSRYLNISENFCNDNGQCSSTQLPSSAPENASFILYRTSFMWHSAFGVFLATILVSIGILLTGWRNNVIPADSKCLSPVTRIWMKNTAPSSEEEKDKTKCDTIAITQLGH